MSASRTWFCRGGVAASNANVGVLRGEALRGDAGELFAEDVVLEWVRERGGVGGGEIGPGDGGEHREGRGAADGIGERAPAADGVGADVDADAAGVAVVREDGGMREGCGVGDGVQPGAQVVVVREIVEGDPEDGAVRVEAGDGFELWSKSAVRRLWSATFIEVEVGAGGRGEDDAGEAGAFGVVRGRGPGVQLEGAAVDLPEGGVFREREVAHEAAVVRGDVDGMHRVRRIVV